MLSIRINHATACLVRVSGIGNGVFVHAASIARSRKSRLSVGARVQTRVRAVDRVGVGTPACVCSRSSRPERYVRARVLVSCCACLACVLSM